MYGSIIEGISTIPKELPCKYNFIYSCYRSGIYRRVIAPESSSCYAPGGRPMCVEQQLDLSSRESAGVTWATVALISPHCGLWRAPALPEVGDRSTCPARAASLPAAGTS